MQTWRSSRAGGRSERPGLARQHPGQQDQQGDQGVGERPGLPGAPAQVLHAWRFSSADTVLNLGWGTGQPWALTYALITLLILLARMLPRQPRPL